MIDISGKVTTLRTAKAQATLKASGDVVERIRKNDLPKGNPLEVAKVAAILAAKNTSAIIPYCHSLPIDFVGVEYEIKPGEISARVTVKAIHKTGVEMEALTAASVAVLTIYDMAKAFDESMEIVGVRLLGKRGGKSDFDIPTNTSLRAAVLVMSDSAAYGDTEDESGKMIEKRLKNLGIAVIDYSVIPDDARKIRSMLLKYSDKQKLDLVVTTGGTGLSSRDRTPEVMEKIIDREIPGIEEAARAYGQSRMPYAMLSRGRAGMRKRTLIINLPGSTNGVAEYLEVLFPSVLHLFKTLNGERH